MINHAPRVPGVMLLAFLQKLHGPRAKGGSAQKKENPRRNYYERVCHMIALMLYPENMCHTKHDGVDGIAVVRTVYAQHINRVILC